MKILFIGPFLSGGGTGRAANDYLRAITTFTTDIKTKHFGKISGNNEEVLAEKFSNNNFESYDYLIQMCHPKYYYKDFRFKKNIGIFLTKEKYDSYEMDLARCELMDEIITPSKHLEYSLGLKFNGHKAKTNTIGLPVDIELENNKNSAPDLSKELKTTPETKCFYTIANNSNFKNLSQLIVTFIDHYSSRDNVCLVIKTDDKKLKGAVKEIKARRPDRVDLPEIKIIDQFVSDNYIYGLHKTCDVYVNTSYSEYWCYPIVDAWLFGNPVVMSDQTAYISDLHKHINLLNDATYNTNQISGSALGENPNSEYGITANYWLAHQMRYNLKLKETATTDVADMSSYEEIGALIKKCLES